MSGRFGSVLTAMVTPFRDDYSLDLDGAQQLAAYLLDNGTDTLVVAGSTGEAPTLTHEEKGELFRGVVEAARGKGRVIAGTGTYSTAESVELTRLAQAAGCDAALVVCPYYSKPPQRGLVAHFTRVAESTDLPILLYNIPGRTSIRIEHETLLTLAASVSPLCLCQTVNYSVDCGTIGNGNVYTAPNQNTTCTVTATCSLTLISGRI